MLTVKTALTFRNSRTKVGQTSPGFGNAPFLTTALLFLCTALANAQPQPTQGQLDASPSLFAVMSAIQAAGFDANVDSPNNHPLRKSVRDHLAKQNIPILDDLKYFVKQHKKPTASAELSQYISFALATSGPPSFQTTLKEHEVPLDVAALSGFQDLMKQFYEQAKIEEVWKAAQPAIDQVIGVYHEPVAAAVLQANGYLRNVTSGYLGRRYQIFFELLAPPNFVQTRSYKDDFFLVITPTPEMLAAIQKPKPGESAPTPNVDPIRYSYLQYLLDPLSIKYGDLIQKKRGLSDFAKAAPALDDFYKEDFVLLTSVSAIKAVDAKLHGKQGPAMVEQALKEGFILAPHFYEQLPAYEKSEQSFRFFFPDLINSIDLKKEDKRLEGVQFASTKAVRTIKVTREEPVAPELKGVEKTLADAEEILNAKQGDGYLEKSRLLFLKSLEQTDLKPSHAKSYYGLARVAASQKNWELSEKLFGKTLELDPDPRTKAWAHVYLGQLSMKAGEAEGAKSHFETALKIDGASDLAKRTAEQGLKQLSPK